MDIPSTKHLHSPSWDQQPKKKEHHHHHHNSANDSFFNRVFGHHSAESSRAGSPTPPTQSTNKTFSSADSLLTVTNKKQKARHNRNSSTGQLILPTSPISILTTHIPIKGQRRRSFDDPSMEGNKLKPSPIPFSSVSARVTSPIPTARPITPTPNTHYTKIQPVPFPRGGRQIGADTEPIIRRSNSIEHGNNQYRLEDQPSKDKKRHLFRFGKKKTHPGNQPSNAGLSSPRKKSSDIDSRYMADQTAADIQRIYYQQIRDDRKRSTGGNSRKGKDIMGKDSLSHLKLNQNFDNMDGILNEGYRIPPSITSTLVSDPMVFDEGWIAPDSWGVQAASSINTLIPASELAEEDHVDFDDYTIEEQDKYDRPKKTAIIRIYHVTGTLNALELPFNTTVAEILTKLATKMFIQDISKYNLVMTKQNIARVLGPHERPLQIQKLLREQMGYTDEDKNDDCTYLVKFSMLPNISQISEDKDKDLWPHVDLQFRALSTIPIHLYRQAGRIISMDISKNLHVELPMDFAQSCTSLKELWLANNEYSSLPISTQEIVSLESLNISGNRLKDLDHAYLHNIPGLVTLRAVNNLLEHIPDTFSSFQHLTTLDISNNFFTKFPMVICEITSLTYLDISFNKINLFPEEISQLTNLVSLFAIANRITGGLPPGFMRLTKLHELDIRQNLITDLDVVSHLTQLEILLVDYNSTSIVNFEISNLKQLKMYKNHLTQFNLFSGIGYNKTLTELSLSNCKLSSLPDNLFHTTRALEILLLDSNTLNSLPSSIGSLRRLVVLSIQNNNIDTLPAEIGKLGELKVLDAQKNNLKSLPKEIWLCGSLQKLNCSSNLLEGFPEPYSGQVAPTIEHASVNDTTELGAVCIDDDDGVGSIMNSLPSLNAGQGMVNRLEETLSSSPPPQQIQMPPPPNFNPPSFFASPRNHPPPLSLTLRFLLLGDNRLTDDIWSPISLFLELRTLNLSFNDLYEIPPEGLCHQHLYELYLSGNKLTSLPADDIKNLQFMRVLAVNGNKLQTLPAEIGKLRKLLVLDVGNNVLKYNISNWPYDWNWNWNLGLKYLNLSGNKRLEIQRSHPDHHNPKEKDLSDFSALSKLRMLGLMDITFLGGSIPEESHDRRVRTSPSEVNSMSYGVADWLGPNTHLSTWDLVMPRLRGKDDECVFAIFDGSKHPKTGCILTKKLNDELIQTFLTHLNSIKSDESIVSAIRRIFLGLDQKLAKIEDHASGASAVVCYINGTKLYVANVGDALAVISRNNGQAYEITQKHIPLNPSEVSRIRTAGGFVSNSGLLNGELTVSRSFGHFHLIPVVNCNPFVSTIVLNENDEFVIVASRGLWDRMTYQTAVDIARTEKGDLMAAAQKLRDFAITYGADNNLMVMVIGVGDLFQKRDKRFRNRNNNRSGGADGGSEEGLMSKSKRRGKEEVPGDHILARLEREVAPPVSLLALVFTDIKSSTQFWETQPENMRSAIKIHDAIMRRTLRSVGGYEVKTEGDAFMVGFKNITAALLWCFTVQLQLLEADWPAGILDTEEGREIEKDKTVIYKGLSVRMGIHWGAPVSERNPITQRMDYFGPVVNKASRICNAADGGQICVSSDVIAALRNFPSMFDDDADTNDTSDVDDISGTFPVSRDILQLKRLGFQIVELGETRLKGLETPETLSLVYPKQLIGRIETDKIVMMRPDTPMEVTSPKIAPTSVPEMITPSEVVSVDYFNARPKRKSGRTIDPNLVCAMSNLAIRLECLTSGNIHSQRANLLTKHRHKEGGEDVVSSSLGLGSLLEKHIREEASDEELLIMMENCVARVENAASSLYLHRINHFAGVLEKLGEAIEADPTHIMKALQMFAEATAMRK
ncbi:hypothetical protein BDB01DRAFT_809559 [Pilobolus umbonatus]|nr:hypothetical protein BDB01DRAFT_809559 [Pilobolus umbonatus]